MSYDDVNCRRWWIDSAHGVKEALDANADGAVTISDLLAWASYGFHWPAKTAMLIVDGTAVGRFFEVTCATGTGWGSTVFSVFFWLLMLAIVLSSTQPQRR